MEHGTLTDLRSSTFSLMDEDHTLANSVRFVLNQDPRVEFCGYSIPHPSENKVNIRVQTTASSPFFVPFTGLVPYLNGTNFTEWKQRVLFALGFMDLDLALHDAKPADLTVESTPAEKVAFEKWERSNRLCLLFLQGHVESNIKGLIPEQKTAIDFLKVIEEQFVSSIKPQASTLMAKLSSMRYTGEGSIREHIMVMRDISAQLNAMKVTISDAFLVHFILNSLPNEYEAFKISYYTHKVEWTPNELMTMCVQEEERLRGERNHVINFPSHKRKEHVGEGNASKAVQDKGKQKKKSKDITDKCFFCKRTGHQKKECPKYKAWLIKKGDPAKDVLKDALQDLMVMCRHVRTTFDKAVADSKVSQPLQHLNIDKP